MQGELQTLRVGDTICLTPPMGWNSWYVQSEGVSDQAIRETAIAMEEKGLAAHGWTYLNIDDCWMGLKDPQSKAIQPDSKFPNMKSLVDYSEFFLPEGQRKNPHQIFGRYPEDIRKGLATIGPVWLVDRDARQFAEWGIDYVKYDWKEWTLEQGANGYEASSAWARRSGKVVIDVVVPTNTNATIEFPGNRKQVFDTSGAVITGATGVCGRFTATGSTLLPLDFHQLQQQLLHTDLVQPLRGILRPNTRFPGAVQAVTVASCGEEQELVR